MTDEQFTIGDLRFTIPWLGAVDFDPWLSIATLVLAEAASPYSEAHPRRYRLSFSRVIEFHSYRHVIRDECFSIWDPQTNSFQNEEVLESGEIPAGDLVRTDDDGSLYLPDPQFRNPQPPREGFRSFVRDPPGRLRLFWMYTWGSYLEFIYGGELTSVALADEDATREWHRQYETYHRSRAK